MDKRLIEQLNAPTKEERLTALRRLMEARRDKKIDSLPYLIYVNNHIHTFYSFSPYSPSGAVYAALTNGLSTAGIMDHDSVAGAEEFIEAGEIAGIAVTNGFECRVTMGGTQFEGRRLNNPDQISVAYAAMHGIPRHMTARAEEFLAPYRVKRNERNIEMVERLNLLSPVRLSFEGDVLPLSRYNEGGSVTERHILFAFAGRLMEETGRGENLLDFLRKELGVEVSGKNRAKLLETSNDMYRYYLLAVLKSGLVERFYVDAGAECPHVEEFIRLGKELGAITAYAYLGDVGDSVTGDKKTQAFEDSYLDELAQYLADAGFNAVTYMPARNTISQLTRLMSLCERHGLFQISGEDINSPFQSFRCEALKKPEFKRLITSTWALIGHEIAATKRMEDGMFSPDSVAKMPELERRVEEYAEIGRRDI